MRVESFSNSLQTMDRRSCTTRNSKEHVSHLGWQFSTTRMLVFIVCLVTAFVATNRPYRALPARMRPNPENLSVPKKLSEYRKPIEPVTPKELTPGAGAEKSSRSLKRTSSPEKNRAYGKHGKRFPTKRDYQKFSHVQNISGSLQSQTPSNLKSINYTNGSSELSRKVLITEKLLGLESVAWTAESARNCASNGCIVRSNWTRDRWAGGLTESGGTEYRRYFEESVSTASNISGRWPNSTVVRRAISGYEKATCTVVGGAPFNDIPRARSAYIDGEQNGTGLKKIFKTIRINLALPFALKKGRSQTLPLPNEKIDASLGLGTKTDVLFVNTMALQNAGCFGRLEKGTELFEHLRNTIVFVWMIEPRQADYFIGCLKAFEKGRGGPHDNGLKLFPLNPLIPESGIRAILDVIQTVSESEKKFLSIPWTANPRGFMPTTGFLAVLSSLRLCGSVRTKGLTGSVKKSHLNETYTASAYHSIAAERVALEKIANCSMTQRNHMCKTLVSLK